jgi:hypothetical protein
MFSAQRSGQIPYQEWVYHAPALAEIDVLQITHIDEWAYGARHGANPADNSIDQGLPTAISAELDHPDRYWLIAGQRLADWSVRMQLFLHVCRALIKGTGLPSALAVSRAFDRDRARLLDGLGISRASGDFESLAPILHRIAGDTHDRVVGGKS